MQKHSLILVAAAIGLTVSQALAADLPRKAPPAPPPPPPPTWTGCYLGANIGGVFTDASANFGAFGTSELSTSNSGFAGGGQIGCDYQFAGGWVIGIRNMFDWTSLSRDRTFFVPAFGAFPGAAGDVNFRTRWFDTLTGRIGYSWTPSWLLYFQGGGVWANSGTTLTLNGVQFGQTSNTRTGWTIGGGVEWMFAPNWSAFLEGNWMDFGHNDQLVFTPNLPAVCPVGCAFNTHVTAATVLVGVNYRFNWGARTY